MMANWWILVICLRTGAGPQANPMRQPVMEKVLEKPLTTTHRSFMPGREAMETCRLPPKVSSE